jgi:peptide-methionine (S)-S-oxide reductase
MKPIAVTVSSTAVVVAIVLMTSNVWRSAPEASERAVLVPPPAVDIPADSDTRGVAVLAGGCFWGVQGVFQHVKGVSSAVSGYAGGSKRDAEYEIVGLGTTGHAESVEVTYDPHQITYGQLLQIFFWVVHDPTQKNRQGPDFGTQYRSAVFPRDDDQEHVARSYIAQLNDARVFRHEVVTKIEKDRPFYPAEAYHQDFLERNPRYPYIAINDMPKLEDLKRLLPQVYRAAPVLVLSSRSTR